MKSARFILIIILLTTTLQACLSNTSTPVGNILFSDDFSTTNNKWDQINDSSRVTDYYNNAYRIMINDTNSDTWANPGNENFADVRIEVDATKNGGPDDNDFGIICRYTDVDKFYYGVISSDGYYAIMKMSGSTGTPIGQDSMLQSDQIAQGAVTNHIRFDCIGSTLTLYVNGNQVDQQTDPEYTTGNVGLVAGSFTNAGTDIVFDNFIVYKP
jgi:hypothetical protein